MGGGDFNRVDYGNDWLDSFCDSLKITNQGILVTKNNITIMLHNNLEEMIYTEIWRNEDYNVNLYGDSIVIDIGLNVGLASLYFAQNSSVKRIFGFEPDERLYKKAIGNVRLNDKKIIDKIELFNVACADSDKEEIYNDSGIDSAGVKKCQGNLSANNMKIKCVDSAKAIGSIIDTYYGKYNIVVKCDCEGAEYEIFDRLEKTGYFDKIDSFTMEWHCNRRNEIEDIFSRNHYSYYIYTEHGRNFGKCYAFKS